MIKNTQHTEIEKQKEVKKVSMKRKVLNVSYRRDSNTFDDWMKYEVEILNKDGSTELIPAYGKDLQDALSRVVHDSRVEKIQNKTQLIPSVVWILLWFGYIFALAQYSFSLSKEWASISFSIGIVAITLTIGYISNWFRKRNKDK